MRSPGRVHGAVGVARAGGIADLVLDAPAVRVQPAAEGQAGAVLHAVAVRVRRAGLVAPAVEGAVAVRVRRAEGIAATVTAADAVGIGGDAILLAEPVQSAVAVRVAGTELVADAVLAARVVRVLVAPGVVPAVLLARRRTGRSAVRAVELASQSVGVSL